MGPRGRWWVPLVVVPLQLLRTLLTPLYDVTIGVLDKQLARKHEQQLAADIRLAFGAFFGKHAIRIIPNQGVPFPPGFDYAYVTVTLENFLLRFIPGRGELGVLIAPAFAPMDWHDLSLVLDVAKAEDDLQRMEFRDVWHAARSLQPHLQAVTELFTQDRFADVKHRLDREVYTYERFAIRQWETETNARLYGTKR